MPLLPAALTSSMLYFQMVIMAGTVMLAYYFEYTDTFTVNVQGFFCHDSAYRKPYPGPEDSSAVPPVLLYSLAAGVPVLVVSPGVLALAADSLLSPSPSGLRPHQGSGRGSFCFLSPSKLLAAPSPEDSLLWVREGWVRRKPPLSPHATPAPPAVAAVLGDAEATEGKGAVGGNGWVSGMGKGLAFLGESGLDGFCGLASLISSVLLEDEQHPS